jgi:hypothetical protein
MRMVKSVSQAVLKLKTQGRKAKKKGRPCKTINIIILKAQ